MKPNQHSTHWSGLVLACGIITLAAHAPAQQPVILSFELDGLLTWSNAYPDAIASIERWSDAVTTGSVVTVTETVGVSDGSTAIYNYTVDHPIVDPSVTISDGTYSWNDQTGSSSPGNFLGTVSSYETGQVSAIYLSAPSPSGTAIQVEYSYLPVITNQEWLSVYSALATGQVMQATVDMSEDIGLFRVVNRPSPMVLIPGGSNSGTNPLGTTSDGPESYHPWLYPATYSLTVNSFHMDRYEVTNDEMIRVMQWAYDNGHVSADSNFVRNLEGDQQVLLELEYGLRSGIIFGAGVFSMRATKASGYPCVQVTWYGAAAYCNYRAEMEGRTPCYNLSNWACDFGASGYRLPTSEEWEYAARGGLVSKRFPWGDLISYNEANYYANDWTDYDLSCCGYHPTYNDGDRPYLSPVGAFAANGYGLYDMAGNVKEWCNTWHPVQSDQREFRGGSWEEPDQNARIGNIGCVYPYSAQWGIGFRSVRASNQ